MPGRIALVTGAGKRIGSDIARRLAREGWRLALLARASSEGARALASEIVAGGGEAHAFSVDLADPEAGAAAFAEIAAALGPIELLVNNAAMFEADLIGALDLLLWRRQFALDLEAPVSWPRHSRRRCPGIARARSSISSTSACCV